MAETRIDRRHLEVSGEGETVILLNGLLQSAASWGSFARLLEPFFQVIRYDLGNQGSRPGQLYDTAQGHLEDLAEIVDTLGKGRSVLVGQSFGARIALDFALRFPDKVDRLVLAAVASPTLASRYRFIFSNWLRALPEDDDGDWRPFAEAVAPWAFGAGYLREQPSFVSFYAQTIRGSQSRAGIAANLKILLDENTAEKADELASLSIKVPTLVINGADDYLTPANQLDATRRILPRATFHVLQQCGHAVSVEGVRDFERLSLDFLLA